MRKDSYNFGDWNIPTSWDDITLKKFQEINKYYSDKDKRFDIREVIHILADKTIDEVNELPAEFLQIIMEKLSFVTTEPEQKEPTNKIEINGETYQINFMEKLRSGEYIAVEMTTKDDAQNYAGILAILCRKENEIFDSTFENEILPSRVELFENQPITKIIPLISFFMNCYILSVMPSRLSLEVKEAINQERKDIEILHKNGQVSKHTMRSVMKTLKKLEKTINGI